MSLKTKQKLVKLVIAVMYIAMFVSVSISPLWAIITSNVYALTLVYYYGLKQDEGMRKARVRVNEEERNLK